LQDLPQQTNGDDCGAFLCRFALDVVEGKPPSFTASDIPEVRKSINQSSVTEQDFVYRKFTGNDCAVPARKSTTQSCPSEEEEVTLQNGLIADKQED